MRKLKNRFVVKLTNRDCQYGVHCWDFSPCSMSFKSIHYNLFRDRDRYPLSKSTGNIPCHIFMSRQWNSFGDRLPVNPINRYPVFKWGRVTCGFVECHWLLLWTFVMNRTSQIAKFMGPTVTGGFPHKGPVMRNFGISVYVMSLNKHLICRWLETIWRICDVTVIIKREPHSDDWCSMSQ